MGKIIKFVNLSILFIFMFLVVVDVNAERTCKEDFDCRMRYCVYPTIPLCDVKHCRCRRPPNL
ncbi:putative Late nodulin [Medicago truncatula]|uniref:Nodule Cysteine-Rich (NCR) secreted peptide n=1 Tax=Medicago truncatula TaxID=3880 RepID=G7JP15_MEDTR|nr:Nodule Cysteine-Rich (NCR) secreted peptide [Medicago truncatula]RHN58804.1 putative Late nodulin [Medicago truncatula]